MLHFLTLISRNLTSRSQTEEIVRFCVFVEKLRVTVLKIFSAKDIIIIVAGSDKPEIPNSFYCLIFDYNTQLREVRFYDSCG
jgi:hypothetical protein